MKTVRFIALVLIFSALSTLCACDTSPRLHEVGKAYAELTGNAAIVWDLETYGDKLYIGAGDYDKNISPHNAICLNINNMQFEQCGVIDEEQINRFCFISGKLCITGTDPIETDSWDTGNYYLLENGEFVKYRTLPGGIHNFDITEYNGKIYASLGVIAGEYPVCVSDGGEFVQLPITHKDGEPYDTSPYEVIRIYDLFEFQGGLYAVCIIDKSCGLFKLNGEKFELVCSWGNKFKVAKRMFVPILSKKVYDGKLYFTTGYLYSTADLEELTEIQPEGCDYITDLYESDGALYALGYTENTDKKNYTVVIYRLDGETFSKINSFDYDIPAFSFVVEKDRVWLGFGAVDKESEKTGMIAYFG